VEDLVKGVILIIEKEATGSFHIAGRDLVTPYAMALATAAICGLNSTLIEKVDASVFSQPAKRPPKTGLDISKATRELGYEPLSLEQGLYRMLRAPLVKR
jgi:dTDP-4-dehydrorhamnose reductase